jgi:hypothetical protein
MTDPFLDDLEEPARPKGGKKAASFSNPTSGLRPGAATRATVKKSLRAGKYIRRQFTFRPEQLDQIHEWAQQFRVPEADLVRWLVDRGIMALESGEEPDEVNVSTKRLASPRGGE